MPSRAVTGIEAQLPFRNRYLSSSLNQDFCLWAAYITLTIIMPRYLLSPFFLLELR